jgi:hypothetical protein
MISNGIPNLIQFAANLWRGGQPKPAGWAYLKSAGVTNVIKLNLTSEGSDALAADSGMTVQAFPITLAQQLFDVDKLNITKAVAAIKPYTFIHCGSDSRTKSWWSAFLKDQGGQDRTGLVVGMYRVSKGWPKSTAYMEMRECGFHPELVGLSEYWTNEVVDIPTSESEASA